MVFSGTDEESEFGNSLSDTNGLGDTTHTEDIHDLERQNSQGFRHTVEHPTATPCRHIQQLRVSVHLVNIPYSRRIVYVL